MEVDFNLRAPNGMREKNCPTSNRSSTHLVTVAAPTERYLKGAVAEGAYNRGEEPGREGRELEREKRPCHIGRVIVGTKVGHKTLHHPLHHAVVDPNDLREDKRVSCQRVVSVREKKLANAIRGFNQRSQTVNVLSPQPHV